MVPLVIVLAVLHFPDAEPAPKKLTKEEWATAKTAAEKKLTTFKGGAARLAALEDEAAVKALPGHALFTVLFPQFPVGRIPPKGLRVANIFAVDRKGTVTVITTAKELEKFFVSSLPAPASDDARKDAARAAVAIGQQLHQDGFFKFKLQDGSTKSEKAGAGFKATAQSTVMSGGNGTYTATLTFSAGGKVTSLEEKSAIRAGPRPICQATKLLDKDPIVRGMAEQALLYMGRAALPYLREQYAKAKPELRRAIGHMMRRIASAGH
jgi:hypothetical protein